jgi:hypothetical protein
MGHPVLGWLLPANIMFFQLLTAITTVVQYSFGKLLRLSLDSYNHCTLALRFSFRLRVGRRGGVVSAL